VHPAERFVGAWVSADAFALLGHRPALGRDFTAEDDRPGAEPVAILGDEVWRRRYGSDPAIVGSIVRVNGVASTVVGVMPAGFGFPLRSSLWQPLAVRGGEGRDDRGRRNIDVFGRLAAGVTIERAEADLARIMARLAREFPATNANVGPIVRPFRDLTTSGPIRTVFTGLMGAGFFLLLIASANVANLLLARGAARVREMTVRLSLGATRRRLVRQLLAESLLVALLAGIAGLALAAVGVRLFQLSAADTGAPYWVEVPLDATVFAFVAVVCLGVTMLCGLAPALYASKAAPAPLLGNLARGGAPALHGGRWTDGFVVAQLALSLTLLAAAGLWVRHVHAFARLDPGVDTSGLIAARVGLPARTYADDEARRLFYRRLSERLAALQGMRAGITSALPFGGAARRGVLTGGTPGSAESWPVSTVTVGPGYLEALGVAPLRGRLFIAGDDGAAASAAIVNERLAGQLFPGEEPLGRTIRLAPATPREPPGEALTIVGIVPNVRQASPRQESVDPRVEEPVLYTTYAATPLPSATIVVRASSGPGEVAATLRSVLAALDSDLPLTGGVVPVAEAMEEELGVLTTFASMFGLFSFASVGLAMVGLYAVTAHGVAQRTRELGVRLALGARARHVWWVVTRRAAMQLTVGLALGLAGAFGAGQLMQGLLLGVSSRDPVTAVAAPALMIAVALGACCGPAWRAMRLDPASVLRAE
jgi:predicted permease